MICSGSQSKEQEKRAQHKKNVRKRLKSNKNTSMYKLKTVTRPDGTKYESAFWINPEPQTWTQEQELTARAIESFGTSS